MMGRVSPLPLSPEASLLARQRSDAAKQMLYELAEGSIVYLEAPDKYAIDVDARHTLEERMLKFNNEYPPRERPIESDSSEEITIRNYLENIPAWLKAPQLDRIARAAHGPKEYKIKMRNNWYTKWMERLEHIGVFGAKVLMSYTGTPTSPIFVEAFNRGVTSFILGSVLGLYEFLAATGINPFVYREGEVDQFQTLMAVFARTAASRHALDMMKQSGVKTRLDQLKKEMRPPRLVERKEDGAQQALSVSVVDPEFELKLSQPVEQLEVDSFSFAEEKCPLWSSYQVSKLIGYGSYGFVCKFTRGYRADNLKLENYAIKFQRFSESDVTKAADGKLINVYSAPYVELRVSYEVNRMMNHAEHRRALFMNIIRLYDWVKCEIDPVDKFALSLTPEQRKDRDLLLMLDKSEYQIIVSEFAEEGSLDHFLTSSRGSFDLFTRGRGFASLLVQVFGTLLTLHSNIGFVHHDCKTPNLLVQPIDPRAGIDYLVYTNIPGGPLYVPLADTGFRVVKLGDMGMSRVELPNGSIIANNTDWFSSVDNPAHDLQDFAVFLLWDMINLQQEKSPTTIGDMEKSTLRKLASMIRQDWKADISDEGIVMDSHYKTVTEALDLWIKGDELSGLDDDLGLLDFEVSLSKLYHARGWISEVKKEHMTAYQDLFNDPMFDVFRKRPRGLTEANSVVADDFRIPKADSVGYRVSAVPLAETLLSKTSVPEQLPARAPSMLRDSPTQQEPASPPAAATTAATIAVVPAPPEVAAPGKVPPRTKKAEVTAMRRDVSQLRDRTKIRPAAKYRDPNYDWCISCKTKKRAVVSKIGHQIGFFCSQECSDRHWTERVP